MEMLSMHYHIIKELIEEACGQNVLEENENFILGFDQTLNREVIFRFSDKVDLNDIFDFANVKMDEAKFFNLMELMTKCWFMNIRKVIFVTSTDCSPDSALESQTKNATNGFDEFGKYIYTKGIIVIDYTSILESIKAESKDDSSMTKDFLSVGNSIEHMPKFTA